MTKIKILSKIDLLAQVRARPGVFSFINPYSVQLLNAELFEGIWFGVDSYYLAKLLSIKFKTKIVHSSFDNSSLAPLIFDMAEAKGWRVFLLGGKQHEAQKFISSYNTIHSRSNIFLG